MEEYYCIFCLQGDRGADGKRGGVGLPGVDVLCHCMCIWIVCVCLHVCMCLKYVNTDMAFAFMQGPAGVPGVQGAAGPVVS